MNKNNFKIDITLKVPSATITPSNEHKYVEVELKDISIEQVVDQIDLENIVGEIGITKILSEIGIEEMLEEIGIKKISEIVGQEVIEYLEEEKAKKIEQKSW